MATKVLAILQTDPARWPGAAPSAALVAHTRALRRAGADVHLLVRGEALTYAVRGPANDGAVRERGAARGDGGAHEGADVSLASLLRREANVFYVDDDARAHQLGAADLVDSLKPVRSADLPALIGGYERVWHW